MLDFITRIIEWLTGVWSFLFDFMAAVPAALIANPGALAVGVAIVLAFTAATLITRNR